MLNLCIYKQNSQWLITLHDIPKCDFASQVYHMILIQPIQIRHQAKIMLNNPVIGLSFLLSGGLLNIIGMGGTNSKATV